MIIEDVKDPLNDGHDIEFNFNKKRYSLTLREAGGKRVAVFRELNKPAIEFETIDEMLDAEYDGFKIADAIRSLSDEDMDIF